MHTYQSIRMSINWITQRMASDALGVSESTLQKWRNKDKILVIGKHFRRKTPTNQQLLYNLEACENTLSKLCITPIEA